MKLEKHECILGETLQISVYICLLRPYLSSILYVHVSLHPHCVLPTLNCVTQRMSQQYFDQWTSYKFV